MKPRSFKPRSQFTLIELLTVLAVLAILMAMLFPGLRRAKMMAKGGACIGNLKEQYLAYYSYTEDWDEHFPMKHDHAWSTDDIWAHMGGWGGNYDVVGESIRYQLQLHQYIGVHEVLDTNFPANYKNNGSIYTNNPNGSNGGVYVFQDAGAGPWQIFNCPGDIGATPGHGGWNTGENTMWDTDGVSVYHYNNGGNSPTGAWGLMRRAMYEVTNHSYTILSTCRSAAGAYGGGMGAPYPPYGPTQWMPYTYTYWHDAEADSAGPALFVDGSARSITLSMAWDGNANTLSTLYGKQFGFGAGEYSPEKFRDFSWAFREPSWGETSPD